jgi:hypothetical protein
MATSKIGTAVLELTTDVSKMTSGINTGVAAVKGLESQVQATSKTIAGIGQALNGALGLGDIGKQGLAFATGFITAQAAMTAAKLGAEALAGEIKTLVMDGSAVSDVAGNFERLTSQVGLTGSALLGALRTGTHNTIADFELMKTVNQDLAAGLRLTDQQFGTLAKGAFALAQATGTDVKTAFDTMNDAMLTGRTRALAMLTGKLDLEAAEKKYAASLGTTAEHLSEEGKLEAARAAILDGVGAATARLGDQVDGLDEHVAQAQVSWQNFHNELAKTVAESPVLEAAFDAIQQAIADSLGADQEQLVKAVAGAIDDAAIAAVGFAKVGVTAGSAVAVEMIALYKVLGDIAQIVDLVALGFKGASLAAAEFFSIGGRAGPMADDVARIGKEMDMITERITARGKNLQSADALQLRLGDTSGIMKSLDDVRAKMVAARESAASFVGPLQDVAAAHMAAGTAAGSHANLTQKSKKEIGEAEAAAKKFTDALTELSTATIGYAGIIDTVDGSVAEAVKFYLQAGVSQGDLATAYALTATQVKALATQLENETKWQKAVGDATSFMRPFQATLDTINGTVVEGAKALLDHGAKLEDVRIAYGLTEGQIAAVNEQLKFENLLLQATKSTMDSVERAGANAGFSKNLKAGSDAVRDAVETENKARLDQYDFQVFLIHREAQDRKDALDKEAEGYQDALGAIDRDTDAKMADAARAWSEHIDEMKASADTLGNSFLGWIESIPQLLQSAFTGGGGFSGALQALESKIGGDIGGSLFKAGGVLSSLGGKLSQALGNILGKGVGDAIGLALPGIGQAIGALLGPLASKLTFFFQDLFGGPSKKELEGRVVVGDFEKQFASTADMINKVGAAYIANGKSAAQAQAAIQKLWAAEKQGAEATKKALEEINAELSRQQEITDAIHGEGFQSQDEIRHAADIAGAAHDEMASHPDQYTEAQIDAAYRHYQELLAQLEGAAGAAARAWLEAHKAADDAAAASSEAMQSAEADLKGLIDQRNALAKGIAAEAPEEVMGVIEAQQRSELAVLDKQIQEKADAYAKLAQETGQAMKDAIVEALKSIHIDPVHVPVVVDRPSTEAPEPTPGSRGDRDFSGADYNGEVPEAAHTGALVTSGGLRRYHTGTMPVVTPDRRLVPAKGTADRLAPDEVPAILQVGEAVLNRPAVRALGETVIAALNHGAKPFEALRQQAPALSASGESASADSHGVSGVGRILNTAMGTVLNDPGGQSAAAAGEASGATPSETKAAARQRRDSGLADTTLETTLQSIAARFIGQHIDSVHEPVMYDENGRRVVAPAAAPGKGDAHAWALVTPQGAHRYHAGTERVERVAAFGQLTSDAKPTIGGVGNNRPAVQAIGQDIIAALNRGSEPFETLRQNAPTLGTSSPQTDNSLGSWSRGLQFADLQSVTATTRAVLDEQGRLAASSAREASDDISGETKAAWDHQQRIMVEGASHTVDDLLRQIAERFSGVRLDPMQIPIEYLNDRGPVRLIDDPAAGAYGELSADDSDIASTGGVAFPLREVRTATRDYFPMARGGFGSFDRPTAFIAGESGAEDVVFGGAGRHLGRDVARELAALLPTAGSGTPPEIVVHSHVHSQLYVDGQPMAENTVRHIERGNGGLDVRLRDKLVPA